MPVVDLDEDLERTRQHRLLEHLAPAPCRAQQWRAGAARTPAAPTPRRSPSSIRMRREYWRSRSSYAASGSTSARPSASSSAGSTRIRPWPYALALTTASTCVPGAFSRTFARLLRSAARLIWAYSGRDIAAGAWRLEDARKMRESRRRGPRHVRAVNHGIKPRAARPRHYNHPRLRIRLQRSRRGTRRRPVALRGARGHCEDMKAGFYTIMAAQFFSSLADNALLIAAIRCCTSSQAPEWMTPALKQSLRRLLRRARAARRRVRRLDAEGPRHAHHQRDQGGRLHAHAVHAAPARRLRGRGLRRRRVLAREVRHPHRAPAREAARRGQRMDRRHDGRLDRPRRAARRLADQPGRVRRCCSASTCR